MKVFKLWVRIEVMDEETNEHEDLNPSLCEYKVGEFSSLEETAAFIEGFGLVGTQGDVINELKYVYKSQFGEDRYDG